MANQAIPRDLQAKCAALATENVTFQNFMKLGEGAFGQVVRGTYTSSSDGQRHIVAVKLARSSTAHGADPIAAIINEFKQLYTVSSRASPHPNVISAFRGGQIVESGRRAGYIIMSLATGGNLQESIDTGKLPVSKAQVCSDILTGLSYTHSRGIYHRDMKPENCLFGLESGKYVCKIADFGLATTDPISQPCGTMVFLAPEAHSRGHHQCEKMDIFATGATLWCVIFNRLPWKTVDGLKSFSYNASYNSQCTRQEYMAIFASSLNYSPHKRERAVDLCRRVHQFYQPGAAEMPGQFGQPQAQFGQQMPGHFPQQIPSPFAQQMPAQQQGGKQRAPDPPVNAAADMFEKLNLGGGGFRNESERDRDRDRHGREHRRHQHDDFEDEDRERGHRHRHRHDDFEDEDRGERHRHRHREHRERREDRHLEDRHREDRHEHIDRRPERGQPGVNIVTGAAAERMLANLRKQGIKC